jgi:F0F1-type ATP synthase assembly protein I
MNGFMENLAPVIAIVFTFGIPGVLIFWYIWVKHKERTKLMDMGLSPQEARDYFRESEKRPKNPYSTLKWGILFTAVGIGLFLGIILDELGFKNEITGVLVLLFAGIGFIVYYVIASSKMKKDEAAKLNTAKNDAVQS